MLVSFPLGEAATVISCLIVRAFDVGQVARRDALVAAARIGSRRSVVAVGRRAFAPGRRRSPWSATLMVAAVEIVEIWIADMRREPGRGAADRVADLASSAAGFHLLELIGEPALHGGVGQRREQFTLLRQWPCAPPRCRRAWRRRGLGVAQQSEASGTGFATRNPGRSCRRSRGRCSAPSCAERVERAARRPPARPSCSRPRPVAAAVAAHIEAQHAITRRPAEARAARPTCRRRNSANG